METATLVGKLQSGVVRKTAPLLSIGLFISAVGTWLGSGITNPWAMVALLIGFFAGIFIVPWQKSKSITRGLVALSVWLLITGMFIGPAIAQYTKVLGYEVVLQCYVGTIAVMLGTWVVASTSRYDFGKLGPVLFTALWGLILVGIIGLFVSITGVVNTVYSLIGMVVFAGYFLYDFNRAKKLDNTWENAIDLTMNLTLNFYNFLLFFLRLRSGGSRS